MEHINWYPGHMKKTRELIRDNMKMVDLVIEVIDARIPVSSRNPIIDELVGGKARIIVLNKSDLADSSENARWEKALAAQGKSDPENGEKAGEANVIKALTVDCISGKGIKELFSELEKENARRDAASLRKKPLRLMIVGVPNVGKSTLINRLTGKKSTQTGNRPGVTRGKQWLTLTNGMQLLDTPGILWPKLEDPKTGLNLAYCGSIRDEILDISDLALEFIRYMKENYKTLLEERYKIDIDGILSQDGEEDDIYGGSGEVIQDEALAIMEEIARKRGCILPGKRIDYERCARMVIDEFRAGKIGRITLEKA